MAITICSTYSVLSIRRILRTVGYMDWRPILPWPGPPQIMKNRNDNKNIMEIKQEIIS